MSPRSRGFTLIELLVTLVVLGLLAAVAIPRLTGSSERTYDAAAVADLRNAITAAETFYADSGRYPSGIGEMDFTPSEGVVFTQFSVETQGGTQSIHIHVEHERSGHYFHAHYPAESGFERRSK